MAAGLAPKPLTAGHNAGPVSRPLRHSFEPYSGINTLVLWGTAVDRGYAAPIWMTFRQALELGGAVRKGEKRVILVDGEPMGAVNRVPADFETQYHGAITIDTGS